ncbi:putative transposase/invertase (TIGR01784 family) [Erwinia sp. JUb26]|nr:putative transposase/invertase (TIGR01784 family) [Erwinia sp. JUb26]
MQKHIHQRDLAGLLDRLATLILAKHMTGQQLVTLVNYFAQTAELSDVEAFIRKLAQRVPPHKEQLMTLAEQLEKKGMKKGILLGEQRGKRTATLNIARMMLHNGLDPATVMKMTGLSENDLAEIPL